ncbi:MAG: VacJ family lipoprotein [Candidatus Contendobacter sp.]|jgi:phospholipid-binding lipoprotein MlaA|nr:VacJ family lipoprotein [Gammaproteobacteria bacterium]MCC8993744.1 VacJ family lipoprotein [Candidatus Contendobacter sp.]
MNTFRHCFLALAAAALLTGCASTTDLADEDADALESYNRAMFAFNDAVDKAVFKPVAKVYWRVLPEPVTDSVGNFFSNLNDVVVLANDLLQFKLHQAAMDSSRIVFNTTFGLGGLFDVATRMELPKHREDFGQTLGVWGFGAGPYLVLPLLGPSTVRDTFGVAGDFMINPIDWATDSEAVKWGLWGLNLINRRASLLRIERALVDEQIDPYSFQRSAYLQMRRNLIYDGNPPKPNLQLETEPDNPVQ